MRFPSVAGTFYDSNKENLKKEIENYISKAKESEELKALIKRDTVGIVSPHAGYTYSGWIAGYSYATLIDEKASFVIIGPNHTGRGSMVALSKEDWSTPLGIVKNDREIGNSIKRNSKMIDFDETAHTFEHSIEVQIPFLQTIFKNPKVVEICVSFQNYEVAKDLGNAIYQAEKETRKSIIVIASSDFTHFEPAKDAKEKDMRAIKYIEKLDPESFVNLIESEGMSICGYAPIAAAMIFAKNKNAKAKLLKYGNSGDVTGDYSSVVGYGSLCFYK